MDFFYDFYLFSDEEYSLKTAALKASKMIAEREVYSPYSDCCYTDVTQYDDNGWADYSLSFDQT